MPDALVAAPPALDIAAQDRLFRQARTPNSFTAEPVADEQLRAIYELIKWAPTAFNAQPLRVVLVRSDGAGARLIGHLSGSNAAKAESAPLVAILAADLRFDEELPKVFPHFPGAKDATSATRRRVRRPHCPTGSCRSGTSSWACGRPASRPAR
jgi:3-hydroxypropanoate dehydrogenase